MKRAILIISVFAFFLFILGCSVQRLSEDEYAKKAVDAFHQGKLDDA